MKWVINPALGKKLSRLSFVCALLVVCIHCTYRIDDFDVLPPSFAWAQAFMNFGMTRIAVPLFFVIFGFLFYRDFEPNLNWWLRKLSARARSLVLPYFVWVAISLVVALSFNALRSHAEPTDFNSIAWWLKAWGITAPPPSLYVLWFVREIIIFLVIAPLVGWLVVRFGFILPFFLFGAGIAGYNMLGHWAFITTGAYVAIEGVPPLVRALRRKALLVIFGMLWLTLIALVVAIRIGNECLDDWLVAFLIYCMNIVGMVFVWFAYDYIDSWRWWNGVDCVAKSAFIIYTMHTLVSLVVQYPMMKFGLPGFSPFLYCVLSYLIMVVVPITFWMWLKHHAPRFLCLALSGGR